MVFWHVFLKSFKLPQKKATFTLNRIGMDVVVVYLFILLLIVSIPAFIEQIQSESILKFNVELFFLMIYFFIFYYLPLTVIMFGLISLTAYIGKGLAYIMQRKLHFSILWKMTAFSITFPFTIYTVIALIYPISDKLLWFSLIYAIIILLKIITIYPRRRIAKQPKK